MDENSSNTGSSPILKNHLLFNQSSNQNREIANQNIPASTISFGVLGINTCNCMTGVCLKEYCFCVQNKKKCTQDCLCKGECEQFKTQKKSVIIYVN